MDTRLTDSSDVAALLSLAHRRGARFWAENGQLRYRAPKGAFTAAEIERLRGASGQIIAMLEGTKAGSTDEGRIARRSSEGPAPLTYAQLAHWRLYGLDRRTSARHVTAALRLQGRLDRGALRASVGMLMQRHEALRTRIVMSGGEPVQNIDAAQEHPLPVEDLAMLEGAARDRAMRESIERLVLHPIDVALGPLFDARLLRLSEREHMLVLVMEHIISDGFSRNVLCRDLANAYSDLKLGTFKPLDNTPLQFADYAAWEQGEGAESLQRKATQWRERLHGCARLRLGGDSRECDSASAGRASLSFSIGSAVTEALRAWSRQRRTTLVMAVFTAYAALVLRWCGVREGVLQYLTAGRSRSELDDTVGYFASPLYLRLALQGKESFLDLLKQATREYGEASVHADASCIASGGTPSDFTANPAFNWQPHGTTQRYAWAERSAEAAVECVPVRIVTPTLAQLRIDREPEIVFVEHEHEITVCVYFSAGIVTRATIERFAGNLIQFIERMLERPEDSIGLIPLQA